MLLGVQVFLMALLAVLQSGAGVWCNNCLAVTFSGQMMGSCDEPTREDCGSSITTCSRMISLVTSSVGGERTQYEYTLLSCSSRDATTGCSETSDSVQQEVGKIDMSGLKIGNGGFALPDVGGSVKYSGKVCTCKGELCNGAAFINAGGVLLSVCIALSTLLIIKLVQ